MNALGSSFGIRVWRLLSRSNATPMSTIGCVMTLSESSLVFGLKSPAASATFDFDNTHVSNTGMTPSTSVFNSRMYFASSSATSRMMSSIVAFSRRLRVVRTLRADRMLVALPGAAESGRDSNETRSECFVNRRFGCDLLLFFRGIESLLRVESCVMVVCDSSEELSTLEVTVLSVSTDAIVDRAWIPVVGGRRRLWVGSGGNTSSSSSSALNGGKSGSFRPFFVSAGD